jgi:hypothetical protein
MFEQTTDLFDPSALIRRVGVDMARKMSRTPMERACVDAATAMDRAEQTDSNVVIGSSAVSCLPYRQLPAGGQPFTRKMGYICYTLDCGTREDGVGEIGIPFGAKARLILLHLINAAASSGSPIVDVRGSMAAWISAMNTPLGGMSYRHITDMSRRIQLTKLKIHDESINSDFGAHGFVERLEFGSDSENRGFPTSVILDRGFYRHAMANTVLLERTAIGLISNNGWAIDMYIWLRIMSPGPGERRHVTWDSLFVGFNSGKSSCRRIKARLLETLPLAMALCPGVTIAASRQGLLLSTCTSSLRSP